MGQASPIREERRVELSIVMPCLNEADTLAACIEKAQAVLRAGQIHGEVIVADNGSTGGSQAIAESMCTPDFGGGPTTSTAA